MLKRILGLTGLALFPAAQALANPCSGSASLDLSKADARVLVLGEMHGTNEFAGLAKKIVCQLAKTEPFVILGLEFPHGEQARINAYMNSSGTPQDQKTLTDSLFWNEKWQDGRRSQAMFSLVEHMRRMRQAGANVAVDAFDVQESDRPEPLTQDERLPRDARDTFMAQHIEWRVAQYPKARYFALTGRLHAAKVMGVDAKWSSGAEPMAMRLNQRVPVFSIEGTWTGGMAWACWERDSASGCTAKAVDPSETGNKFDLRVDLGQLTASPPQNPKP
jgi:erythromycin esterase-like protein